MLLVAWRTVARFDGPRAGVALLAPAEAPQVRDPDVRPGQLESGGAGLAGSLGGFPRASRLRRGARGLIGRGGRQFRRHSPSGASEEGGRQVGYQMAQAGLQVVASLGGGRDCGGLPHRPLERQPAPGPTGALRRPPRAAERRACGQRPSAGGRQVPGGAPEGGEIRALFWRPGTPPKDAKAKVLVAASEGCGGLAAAQAACCAHGLLYEEAKNVESAWRRLSGQSPQALGEWQTMLDTLVSPAESAESDTGRQEEEVPKEAPVEASDGREDPERPLDADVDDNEGEPEVERTPQWTYRCRKCGVALFHDLDVLPHQKGKDRLAGYDWRSQAVAAAAEGHALCSSMFVQPMKWMGDITCQTGRLVCGNGLCKQKLGGFSWHGLPCSCGEWQSPAFQIHNA
ncbi:unnamed protein product, partial [Effrenium voratum]